MHTWNDSWPYWDELNTAQSYFCKLYQKCTDVRPITKEKYGTIRYEHTNIWITSEETGRIFRECIMRTIRKFPNVAGEIADDAGHVLNNDYFQGWCAGVVFKSNGSYWSSNKRPKGV